METKLKNKILWRYIKRNKDIPRKEEKEFYKVLEAVNKALNGEGYHLIKK